MLSVRGMGGGGEGEHVDLGAQGLHLFLVADPEAVLLVDDDEPEILELDRGLEELVGADHDVEGAGGQAVEDHLLLLGGAEARQALDPDRPVGEAVGEVLEVLLGEQGGGYQHRHLTPAVGGNEGGAHGDLGLAETDVAAHYPVHRLGVLHVGEHPVDGAELVGGLLEGEGGGEGGVLLPRGRTGEAGAGGAAGVEVEQLGGDVADLLGGLALELVPLVAAQAVQRGVLGGGAGVTGDQVQ